MTRDERLQLEPAAVDHHLASSEVYEREVVHSIGISLKRIADSIDRLTLIADQIEMNTRRYS